jgi:hypothetical protein
LTIRLRGLHNKGIYYRGVDKKFKPGKYIFQSLRSIIFKGFQKVFYSVFTGINLGDSETPFKKKEENRYSVNESRHIL